MNRIDRQSLVNLAKDKGIEITLVENQQTGEPGLQIKNTVFYNSDKAHEVLRNWEVYGRK